MQWLRGIVADLFTRTKCKLLWACKKDPLKCPPSPPKCPPSPPECPPLPPQCPPSPPECPPPPICPQPPPKCPPTQCFSPFYQQSTFCGHFPPPKCYPLPYSTPSYFSNCFPPPPAPASPPCKPPKGWKCANRKYPNPIKTPRAGIWPILALLIGIAAGFGLVTYLNRTKPKSPRKLYCYPAPPPSVERDHPPNCCQPKVVELYDDGRIVVPGKRYIQLPECVKIKITDPTKPDPRDPCLGVSCPAQDE